MKSGGENFTGCTAISYIRDGWRRISVPIDEELTGVVQLKTHPALDDSIDKNAIHYASTLLKKHSDKVSFLNKNILRFSPDKKYDLVWSAGLFDYFNDEVFKKLLTRFLNHVKPGGEMIVGNFCTTNPDLLYMEIVDWKLYHRNTEDLIRLALECGINREQISVEKEPEAVNLFIRIKV